MGIAGTLVLLFALLGAVDSRFVTRREYDATMKGIQRQLSSIAKQVGAASDVED